MDIKFVLSFFAKVYFNTSVEYALFKHIPNTHSKVKKILGDYLLLSTSLNV